MVQGYVLNYHSPYFAESDMRSRSDTNMAGYWLCCVCRSVNNPALFQSACPAACAITSAQHATSTLQHQSLALPLFRNSERKVSMMFRVFEFASKLSFAGRSRIWHRRQLSDYCGNTTELPGFAISYSTSFVIR